MNCRFVIVILTVFIINSSYGKEKNRVLYPVASIPESLKKDANAVCRLYEHEFELIDYGKAIEKLHLVITVLNENGDSFSQLRLKYDNSEKIKNISGRSYNELGIPDDKLKNNVIQDVNVATGAIFDDLRMKYAEHKTSTYPYTVEYEIEIEHNELLGYPQWEPLDEYRMSVEKSSFKLIYPDNLKIRFKEFNLTPDSRYEKKEGGKNYMEWKVDSLPAWKEEPLSPSLIALTPCVILAPVTFNYHETVGDMSTWKSFGKWVLGLSDGLNRLSEARQTEIRNIAGTTNDTIAAIQALYKYMQQRTRYVGIQLGLGGYKPFPAETVDKLGYGDCKALSNYMKALLACAGIKSIYTLAGAGSNKGIIMPDFPTVGQNNHAILCVPLKNDTIWLECTDQTAPCGFVGRFVQDRRVLLITENGGVLAKTPSLTANQNLQSRFATVTLQPDGSMQADAKTLFKGYQYDELSSQLDKGQEDQKKELLKDYHLPGLAINSLSYTVKKDRIPEVVENIKMNSTKYATKSGSRLFVPLNMLNKLETGLEKLENRRTPIIQSYAFHDSDSIIYQLPIGVTVESSPRTITMKTEFGEYNSSVVIDKNKAVYVRSLKINNGTWPKEKYPELVGFYDQVVTSDKAKLVLKVQ